MKLYHATYQAYLESIFELGLGARQRKNWDISTDGGVCFADDMGLAISFCETAEDVDAAVYESGVVCIEVDSGCFLDALLFLDPNWKDEENPDACFMYRGVVAPEDLKVVYEEKYIVCQGEDNMIVDKILDRKDGALCREPYSAHDFYMACMSYGRIADEITRAMDGGMEEDVKEALCSYVLDNKCNPLLCDYIRRINWVEKTHPAVEMAAAMEFNWANAARYGEQPDKMNVYLFESGVLVGPEDAEFDYYTNNNPNLPYGFYDEDQGVVLELDLARILDAMKTYVEQGVEGTYAVVAQQGTADFGSDEYKDIFNGEFDVSGISYEHFKDPDKVLWSMCKMDGRLVEGFLEDMLRGRYLDDILARAAHHCCPVEGNGELLPYDRGTQELTV